MLIAAAVLQHTSGFLYYCAALYAVGHSNFGHCHITYLTLCFKNSLSYVFIFFVFIVLMDFYFHLFTAWMHLLLQVLLISVCRWTNYRN